MWGVPIRLAERAGRFMDVEWWRVFALRVQVVMCVEVLSADIPGYLHTRYPGTAARYPGNFRIRFSWIDPTLGCFTGAQG